MDPASLEIPGESGSWHFWKRDLFRYSRRTVWEKEHRGCPDPPGKESKAGSVQRAAGEIRVPGAPGRRLRYREIARDHQQIWRRVRETIWRKPVPSYGIPVFMDHKRSILLNPFVEYLRSLLAYGGAELYL